MFEADAAGTRNSLLKLSSPKAFARFTALRRAFSDGILPQEPYSVHSNPLLAWELACRMKNAFMSYLEVSECSENAIAETSWG